MPSTFIENLVVRTNNVLTNSPGVEVVCFVQHLEPAKEVRRLKLKCWMASELWPGFVATACFRRCEQSGSHSVRLEGLKGISLWDLDKRNLYTARVRLRRGSEVIDEESRRFGLRGAVYGPWIRTQRKSHQVPWTQSSSDISLGWSGDAARAQRRDAEIFRNKLSAISCARRTTRSRAHFIDACDEIGPARAGGDSRLAAHRRCTWQDTGGRQRSPHDPPRPESSRHHPVGRAHQRIRDNHDFYARTNALAHSSIQRARPAASGFPGVGAARRRLHHERLRLSAQTSQSSALPEYGIRRAHVPTKTIRQVEV